MTAAIHRMRTGSRMSKIVRCADMIFLSGQTSVGESLAGVASQTREVLKRIDGLLEEAGSHKSRLLSATIYLRDIADFDAMNAEWEAWMPKDAAPARTTVEARLAAPDLLVEITVVASG